MSQVGAEHAEGGGLGAVGEEEVAHPSENSAQRSFC